MSSYEVLAVRYGTRIARKAETYLNYHIYGEPDADLPMDYFFWVVRDAARTIVVDCGFGAEAGARRRRTLLADPAVALTKLGVDPAAVDQLVVTTRGRARPRPRVPGLPRIRPRWPGRPRWCSCRCRTATSWSRSCSVRTGCSPRRSRVP